jgi:hypothetical protein
MAEVPPTPWEEARENQRSDRQESGLARRSGGRRQVNSGRLWWSKRDVTLNGFLVEARTTKSASYTLSKVEFEKLTKDAFGTPPGQLPAMQIDFEGGRPTHLFVMRLQDHEEIVKQMGLMRAEIERLRRDK